MSELRRKILLKSTRRSPIRQFSPSYKKRFTEENENHTDFSLNVCRICLAMNIKMYDMMKHNLNVKYEKVTGVEILSNDKLPQKLCWECVSRLLTANKFRIKALASRKILLNKINGDSFITETDIKQIHEDQLTKKSSLVTHTFKPNTYYTHIIEYEEELVDNNTNYDNNASEIIDLDTDDEEVIASASINCNKGNFNINDNDRIAVVSLNFEESLANKEMITRDSEIAQEAHNSIENIEEVSSANKVVIVSNELIYPINVDPQVEEAFSDDEGLDTDFVLLYDTEETSTKALNTNVINPSTINTRIINSNTINTSAKHGKFEVSIKVENICDEIIVDDKNVNSAENQIKMTATKTKKTEETTKKHRQEIKINKTKTNKENSKVGNIDTNIKINKNKVVHNINSSVVNNHVLNVDSRRKRKSDTIMNFSDENLIKEVKIILLDIGKDPKFEDFFKKRKTFFLCESN